jgi:5'-phosphate synthase pdxT subunit
VTKIGVLALQGGSRAHLRSFAALGFPAVTVRSADSLADVDRLVIPGGESTTISMMLERNDLFDPLAERIAAGMPVFGNDQRCFAAIDLVVRRNDYGTQRESFETSVDVPVLGDEPFPAVFIRAPGVVSVGPDVEVLATHRGTPVVCRQGPVLVSSFHPELSTDLRLHRLFCEGG